jgi:hypothetical protein
LCENRLSETARKPSKPLDCPSSQHLAVHDDVSMLQQLGHIPGPG